MSEDEKEEDVEEEFDANGDLVRKKRMTALDWDKLQEEMMKKSTRRHWFKRHIDMCRRLICVLFEASA